MLKFFTFFVAVILSAGCSTIQSTFGGGGGGGSNGSPSASRVSNDADLVSASYSAAEQLMTQVPWLREKRQPLLTATFVNIDSLQNSSALGRIVAEQISSRFAQDGFTMIEMKLRTNIFIRENAGEFALSRSVKDLSRIHNAAAVIAGTYAVGRRSVFVNARLVRAADNLIIASYDYILPMGPDTKALLALQ